MIFIHPSLNRTLKPLPLPVGPPIKNQNHPCTRRQVAEPARTLPAPPPDQTLGSAMFAQGRQGNEGGLRWRATRPYIHIRPRLPADENQNPNRVGSSSTPCFCSVLLRSCSQEGSIDRPGRVIDLYSIALVNRMGALAICSFAARSWGHSLGFLIGGGFLAFLGMDIAHSSGVSFHVLSRSASLE